MQAIAAIVGNMESSVASDIHPADRARAAMPDEQLMLAYAAGELDAFDALYLRHKDKLYRLLLRQTGNAAIAGELFQDIWINVINSRGRYQAIARFSTWLYRLAHNRVVDFYRSHKHKDSYGCSLQEEAELPATKTADPVWHAQQQQTAQQLKSAIASLPFEQREAFLLKEESGLSLEQIAQVCGAKRETIKSRLRYAVQTLRRYLNEVEVFDVDG